MGQADNTIVIFTADHGISLDSHCLLGKQNMYHHSSRVPLVLAGLGIPKNKRIDADVYLQDVMPTALELAGADMPRTIFYNSLLPLIDQAEPASPYPGGIFGAYVDYQRSLRKGDYKLIVYPKAGVARLYDLTADPAETDDVLAERSEIAWSMFAHLKQEQRRLADTLQLKWSTYAP